jgi:phosphatidylserine/phosphatidylglycerophosphate/cardiolipin synthase-like enzyme
MDRLVTLVGCAWEIHGRVTQGVAYHHGATPPSASKAQPLQSCVWHSPKPGKKQALRCPSGCACRLTHFHLDRFRRGSSEKQSEKQEDTPCANAPLRVVSGLPGRSRIYRLTQVLFANAASRIWITDAYFLTPPTMYEALTAAARDGVDVRVLVPGARTWLGLPG